MTTTHKLCPPCLTFTIGTGDSEVELKPGDTVAVVEPNDCELECQVDAPTGSITTS